MKYLGVNGKDWTDYQNAGSFSIEEASLLVICHVDALISPDSNGEWLVVKIKEKSYESDKV